MLRSNSGPGMAFGFSSAVNVQQRCRSSKCSRYSRTRQRWQMAGVLVTGAGSDLGVEAVKILKALDPESVIALLSKEAAVPSLNDVNVHVANEKDRDAVLELVQTLKPSSILNCIGLEFEEKLEDSHYLGTVNLVDAAVNAGVGRFVLVSALGAGDSEGAVPFQVMDTMRPVLMDKSRSELYLRESGLKYTVVRCGPLSEEESKDPVLTTAMSNCYGGIGVRGLAQLLCDIVASEKSANQTLTAVDTEKLLHVSPYVRPREFWEPVPFSRFEL